MFSAGCATPLPAVTGRDLVRPGVGGGNGWAQWGRAPACAHNCPCVCASVASIGFAPPRPPGQIPLPAWPGRSRTPQVACACQCVATAGGLRGGGQARIGDEGLPRGALQPSVVRRPHRDVGGGWKIWAPSTCRHPPPRAGPVQTMQPLTPNRRRPRPSRPKPGHQGFRWATCRALHPATALLVG